MMGGDGNYGSYGSGWELCGRLGHADGWAMRTDGPGYQPGQLTKEIRRNHQKRKTSKRKTSEK